MQASMISYLKTLPVAVCGLTKAVDWINLNKGDNYPYVEKMEYAVKIIKFAVKPWNLR